MEEFIENGCRLAWLTDPFNKVTYIFSPFREVEKMGFDEYLSGENVLEGFKLRMSDRLSF